jgi:hypothetical protein
MTCLKNRRGQPHVKQENRRARRQRRTAERQAAIKPITVIEPIKPSRPQGEVVETKVRT